MADPWGAGAYYTMMGVYASAQIYLYTGLTNADITYTPLGGSTPYQHPGG